MSKFFPIPDLKSFIRCPLCGQSYNSEKIKVLKKKDNAMVLYLVCPKCKSSVMAMITANPLGITSVSALTDVTEEDMERFKNKNPISVDDILELHTFLEDE